MLILPSLKEIARNIIRRYLLGMHNWLRTTYENMLVRNKAYFLYERIDSNMLNNISKMSKNNVTNGHISQIIGAVVDVKFDVQGQDPEKVLPRIHEALEVSHPDGRILII